MHYCSLMSGSWGNCHYIKGGNTGILIDAGQAGKRILANMNEAGCEPAGSLSAIVVTHAHRDHSAGVGVLARMLRIPVFATEETWYEMDDIVGRIPPGLRNVVDNEEKWAIDDLQLEAFPTPHDVNGSVGYVVRQNGDALGIATDCGVFTNRMEHLLREVRILVLEANHDLDMLRTGPYPQYLKQRISGVTGHLSNESAGKALARIVNPDLGHVMLAHLSQENNTGEKAMRAIRQELPDKCPELSVAPRFSPGQWLSV